MECSRLSIERSHMSGRAVVRLPWSDLTSARLLWFPPSNALFIFPRPPRAGRGAASCPDGRPVALAEGRTDGRERGVGGGEDYLNNDGSVIPFCSFPNIKSHIKFLA